MRKATYICDLCSAELGVGALAFARRVPGDIDEQTAVAMGNVHVCLPCADTIAEIIIARAMKAGGDA